MLRIFKPDLCARQWWIGTVKGARRDSWNLFVVISTCFFSLYNSSQNWRGMKGMLISNAKIRMSKGFRNTAFYILHFRAVKFGDGMYWKALPGTSKDSGSAEWNETNRFSDARVKFEKFCLSFSRRRLNTGFLCMQRCKPLHSFTSVKVYKTASGNYTVLCPFYGILQEIILKTYMWIPICK